MGAKLVGKYYKKLQTLQKRLDKNEKIADNKLRQKDILSFNLLKLVKE
jgi:hypothetical protein